MNKEQLLKSVLPEREIETVAGPVRVRGLSRAEVLSMQAVADDPDAVERRLLELAVIDPVLTSEDVEQWRKAWPAKEFEPLIETISELSGLNTDSEVLDTSFRTTTG